MRIITICTVILAAFYFLMWHVRVSQQIKKALKINMFTIRHRIVDLTDASSMPKTAEPTCVGLGIENVDTTDPEVAMYPAPQISTSNPEPVGITPMPGFV